MVCLGHPVAYSSQTMASSSGSSQLEENLLVILANCKTNPRDVSIMASVNRNFAEAAKSDFVWAKMLPPDYKWAVENAYGGAIRYQSLKELYDRLCAHVLVEDGLKGYGCDPTTGRMYRTFAARTLSIEWGADERYWRWIPGTMFPGARFAEVAYLQQVCWLELQGDIKPRLVPGTYSLYWVLQFAGTSPTSGWETPILFTFTDGGAVQSSEIHFPPSPGDERVQWKDNNWFEYRAGVFTVEETDNPLGESTREMHLKFDMKQTVNSLWKNNLTVDGVTLCSNSRW